MTIPVLLEDLVFLRATEQLRPNSEEKNKIEDLVFLGDTCSRYELLVFAQANPARLPLAMGLVQPDIPARRMANDRKIQLTDALVRIFFCSNALIALARSLCKCLLAQLITASGANAVKGYLVRCACIDGTIP